MSRFARFATVAVLAASLAPFAAQARPAGHVAAAPAEVPTSIPGAQVVQLHGRAAERAVPSAVYSLSGGAREYAFFDADDGFAG